MRAPSKRDLVKLVGLAAIYLAIARLGLLFDAVGGFATLVWPPTGIAIAALVVGGWRLAPAIFLGATVVNVWTGAPVGVALGIGVGNAVEALVAYAILRRWPGFDRALPDVGSLAALAVVSVVATAASPTIGVTALYAGGVARADQLGGMWAAWWIGDMLGALVVGSLLLAWTARGAALKRPREAVAAAVVLVLVAGFVFGPEVALHPLQQVYAVFPVLTWIAVRFGLRGATLATFATAAIAIAATMLGLGPFVHGGLLELQILVAFTATTFMVVAVLAAEARLARERAERAGSVRIDFLRMVSHELRTPLATLMLQIERLAEQDANVLVGKMQIQVTRLRDLIDGVLDYTRVQSDKLTLRVEVIDPRRVVAEWVEEVRPVAAQKQLDLTVEVTDATPAQFATDPALLRLAVLNLVRNALKFTERGRVVVAVDVAPPDVRAGLSIAVRDTGVGIAPEDQARIFDAFEQVDPIRNKHHAGTGLGLAMVRTMIGALDGRIWVESSRGSGSTFTIAVPGADGGPRSGPDHRG